MASEQASHQAHILYGIYPEPLGASGPVPSHLMDPQAPGQVYQPPDAPGLP